MVLHDSKLPDVGYVKEPSLNQKDTSFPPLSVKSRPTCSSPTTTGKPPRAIIFDLGDVLFQWSAQTTTTIPARQLREILSTPVWESYERGELSRAECFEQSARIFPPLQASEIAEAFTQARASVRPDADMVAFLKELRNDRVVEVYAMSNIGREDFEDVLESKRSEDAWLAGLFDRVFTSAAAGRRKPERGFYRYVLDQIGHVGQDVLFIDDKEENIRAATRGFGIHGVVFQNGRATVDLLRSVLFSPVGKGWRYLYRHASGSDSVTETGVRFADNFARLLIADTLQDQSLIDLKWGSRDTWNFFADGDVPALIPGGVFPDDLDTTSLALQVLPPSREGLIATLLDKMLEHVNEDGTFMTYFDASKVRTDPIVSANILTAFYTLSSGSSGFSSVSGSSHHIHRVIEVPRTRKTMAMLLEYLRKRKYLPRGTKYYSSPDVCLFFLGRLLDSIPISEEEDDSCREKLRLLLTQRIHERLTNTTTTTTTTTTTIGDNNSCSSDGVNGRGEGGGNSDALNIACRIVTCARLAIPPCEYEHERRALLAMQDHVSGSWETGWIYQYGSTGIRIRNPGVTTAIAVRALSAMAELDRRTC